MRNQNLLFIVEMDILSELIIGWQAPPINFMSCGNRRRSLGPGMTIYGGPRDKI